MGADHRRSTPCSDVPGATVLNTVPYFFTFWCSSAIGVEPDLRSLAHGAGAVRIEPACGDVKGQIRLSAVIRGSCGQSTG